MKKRGFTLIELLAVIVILAIIALIATPMIMNVIDKAKQGAAEASTLGYVDGIEKYTVLSLIDGTSLTVDKTYDVTKDVQSLNLEYKGATPKTGWFKVDAKGLVTEACLQFDNYNGTIKYTSANGAKAEDCDIPATE